MQPSGSSRSADTIINSSLQPNSSSSFLSSEIVGQQNRTAPATRKRRLDRACDQCRRRKTRCDGIKKAGGTCSNCRTNKSVCTYVETSKPRGPPKSYVTGLEDKLEKMEALLQQLRPHQDFSAELGLPVIRDSWKNPEGETFRSRPYAQPSKLIPHLDEAMSTELSSHLTFNSRPSKSTRDRGPRKAYVDNSQSSQSDSDIDELGYHLKAGMQRLTMHTGDPHPRDRVSYDRFFGKSSPITLVEATKKLKQAHTLAYNQRLGGSNTLAPPSTPDLFRRERYWRVPKWELVYEGIHLESPKLLHFVLREFPHQELAEELVEHYFRHVNSQFSLLNKRLIYRQLRERLHEKDIWFCALLMCIFALGSRWSNHPRVLPRDPQGLQWSMSGWDFLNVAIVIHRARRSLLTTATLFEVQTLSLLALYMQGHAEYSEGRIFVTVGLQKAQDVGAHRKRVYKHHPTPDEEQWKRAFWLLVVLDRTGSANLGRPCSIGEEDFDLDLPLEVDDQYWDTEDPTLALKQPPGVPSTVSAFKLWIQITSVVAYILRTLYVVDPKKMFLGRQTLPDPEILVKQFDVALNEWVRSVPEHLQWPNKTGDPIFSNQSASLHLTYHFTHILIYRAFIPFSDITAPNVRGIRIPPSSSKKPSSLSLSALTICVNAAKACARIVLDQMRQEFSNVPLLITISTVCTSILIIDIWDLKAKEQVERSVPGDIKPHYALSIQDDKENIGIFLNALEWAKSRYSGVPQILYNLRASFPAEHGFGHREHDFSKPPLFLPKFEELASSGRWNLPSPDWELPPLRNNFPSQSHSTPTSPLEQLSSHLLNRGDINPVPGQPAAFLPAPVSRLLSEPRRSSLPNTNYPSSSRFPHAMRITDYNLGDSTGDFREPYQHLPTSDTRSLPTPQSCNRVEWNISRTIHPRGGPQSSQSFFPLS